MNRPIYRLTLSLFAVLVLFLSIDEASAQRQRPFFRASRALAMGDAYTAYDVGYEAVYYNPAGVAMRNRPKFKFLDIEALGSQALVLLIQNSVSDLTSLSSVIENVAANPGQAQVLGISLLPQFIVKNFSIGILARAQTEAFVDSTTADMELYSFADLAAYLHYAVALYGGVIKLGVGFKALDRAEVNRTYTAAEYASGLSFANQWQEGLGFGIDAGMLITLPTTGLPTIGLSVQDIGNTTLKENHILFTGSSAASGSPAALQQRVNLGFSFKIKHGRGVASGFSFEAKHILADPNIFPYVERVHAGWELGINRKLFLRAGVNQGRYWTAGLGVNVGAVGIELASYGENVALSQGSRRDDRKWVGRYVLSF